MPNLVICEGMYALYRVPVLVSVMKQYDMYIHTCKLNTKCNQVTLAHRDLRVYNVFIHNQM